MSPDAVAVNHLHERSSQVITALKRVNSRLSKLSDSVGGSAEKEAENKSRDDSELCLADKFFAMQRLVEEIESETLRLERFIGIHQERDGSADNTIGGIRIS